MKNMRKWSGVRQVQGNGEKARRKELEMRKGKLRDFMTSGYIQADMEIALYAF